MVYGKKDVFAPFRSCFISIVTLPKGLLAGKENRGIEGPRCGVFLFWKDYWHSFKMPSQVFRHRSLATNTRTRSSVASKRKVTTTRGRNVVARNLVSRIGINSAPLLVFNYLRTAEFYHSLGRGAILGWFSKNLKYRGKLILLISYELCRVQGRKHCGRFLLS